MNRIIVHPYLSPCGKLLLGAIGSELCMCDWITSPEYSPVSAYLRSETEFIEGTSSVTDAAAAQLDEYFLGVRSCFNIPLAFFGTEFQKRVWSELLTIPFGRTMTYSEVAERIGKPRAVRAVANAIGANPLSIFVPCHRVTGKNRSLTGYRGGIAAKAQLLNLELKESATDLISL